MVTMHIWADANMLIHGINSHFFNDACARRDRNNRPLKCALMDFCCCLTNDFGHWYTLQIFIIGLMLISPLFFKDEKYTSNTVRNNYFARVVKWWPLLNSLSLFFSLSLCVNKPGRPCRQKDKNQTGRNERWFRFAWIKYTMNLKSSITRRVSFILDRIIWSAGIWRQQYCGRASGDYLIINFVV